MTDDELYEELLDLLTQSHLAARNKQWPTCGTYARRAMELAFSETELRKVEKSIDS
jgi:hypothetical protein